MTDALAAARRLADEVLFPAALEVDRSDRVPAAHLQALAEAGLYGAAGPPDAGGLDLDLADMASLVETLAGGCLATTFVWLQHHGLVRSLSNPVPPGTADHPGGRVGALAAEWLAPLCSGRVRAGIALAGLLPGPPRLRARPAEAGWRVDGSAPWVSGWGLIDVLQVAARGPDDSLVWLMVDAREGAGLTSTRQHLVAVDASRTVQLDFDGYAVPVERHIRSEPYEEADWAGGARLRLNGSLALGLAARCLSLIGDSPLGEELDRCRLDLAQAAPEEMATARAAASELAWRAAAALVVTRGSGSILAGDDAQRLAREALFLLVFGTRPAIRDGLLACLDSRRA